MLRPRPTGNPWQSIRRCVRVVLLLAAALAVAGCARFGDATLEITPTAFSECQGDDIVVHVAWDASRLARGKNVRLFVYKPGQLPKLWMAAAPKGAADTGQWASDGWTVMMKDAKGRVIGMRTLQTTACAADSG